MGRREAPSLSMRPRRRSLAAAKRCRGGINHQIAVVVMVFVLVGSGLEGYAFVGYKLGWIGDVCLVNGHAIVVNG